MAKKPSIPKGTRDFSPGEVAKRNYIIQTIKKHFETYGFQPIETPSFENSETLMGKYGDEGDRLIFKILNSGDYLSQFSKVFRGRTYRLIEDFARDLVNSKGKTSFEVYLKNEKAFSEVLEALFRENYSESNDDFKGVVIFDENYENALLQSLVDNPNIANSLFSDLDGSFELYSGEKKEILENFSKIVFFNWVVDYGNKFSDVISEKALRYDLTVPFARYVVMHQNEIDFPFKRYQIQPVWRADRPQKGRFREFYQCDADVVGANSLLQEVEFVQLYDAVFTDLGLKGATIKINNRKILSGIAEVIGAKDLLVDFTVALDKLDKIGEEKVKTEMTEKGISEGAIAKAQPLFDMKGTAPEQLQKLKAILADSKVGMLGVSELDEIISTVEMVGLQSATLQLDVTLARGLNYYTGAIFEVAAPKGVKMGSIGGGGRYDDLTGIFGLKDVSGVGISFGLDRIYLVLEELNLFPDSLDSSLDVLCLNFGKREGMAALKLVSGLRKQGLRADLYPTDAKVQKQFKYADKRGVPYVILLGDQELTDGKFVAKNMKTGDQKDYPLDSLEEFAEKVKSDF